MGHSDKLPIIKDDNLLPEEIIKYKISKWTNE